MWISMIYLHFITSRHISAQVGRIASIPRFRATRGAERPQQFTTSSAWKKPQWDQTDK